MVVCPKCNSEWFARIEIGKPEANNKFVPPEERCIMNDTVQALMCLKCHLVLMGDNENAGQMIGGMPYEV